MISAPNKNVIVIGGGITGLTVLHYLKRKGIDTSLLEADKQTGGKFLTVESDSFLDDLGPNGFLTSRKEVMDLVRDLSLEDRLIYARQESAIRYVYRNKRLYRIPESPQAFLFSDIVSWKGKLGVIKDFFQKPTPKPIQDETVDQFAIRHFGKEIYENIIDPGFKGIYAAPTSTLSALSCGKALKEAEIAYGSVIKGLLRKSKSRKSIVGKARLASFDKGMSVITSEIAKVNSDAISTSNPVTKIEKKEGGYLIMSGEKSFFANHIVLACPSYISAEIINDIFPELSTLLKEIEFIDLSTWIVEVDVQSNVKGFGFLVPTKENSRILGCLWSSTIFDLNRSISGKKIFRFILEGTTDDMKKECITMLEHSLGAKVTTGQTVFHPWKNGLPIYGVGHQKRLDSIWKLIQKYTGLHLAGFSYDGVAVGDCISNAKSLATSIGNDLSTKKNGV